MPKQTFFNLTEEKRSHITAVSTTEFAQYGYQNANITRIVNAANIAKGSFYQYFEDKKDLYKYIIDEAVKFKMYYLGERAKDIGTKNFFEGLRDIYLAGLELAVRYPELAAIGDQLMRETNVSLKEEILGEGAQVSNAFLEKLIVRGIEQGEIAPDIDVAFVAFIITSINVSISERYLPECKNDEDIMTLVDKMLTMIRQGIENRKG